MTDNTDKNDPKGYMIWDFTSNNAIGWAENYWQAVELEDDETGIIGCSELDGDSQEN